MAGTKGATSPHKAFYYYRMDQLQAVRSGKWKLYLPFKIKRRNQKKAVYNAPLKLYNLKADIAEKNNVADQHPDVVKRLLTLAEKARQDLGDVDREGTGQRPAGLVVTPKPLLFSSK